jgi:pimeloyl-ACP methyl ester carboxylesterase
MVGDWGRKHFFLPQSSLVTLWALHGIGGAAWGRALGALGARSWHLPGYGGTPLLPETSFAGWADALRDALDAAGEAQVDLLGHSIGGMLAQEFALRHPARVRRLVLYATTPAFGGRDPAFATQFLAERLAPLDAGRSMAYLAAESIPPMLRADVPPGLRDAATAALARTPEAAYRATVTCLTTFNRRDDLPQIGAPSLLLAAEHDPLAPPRTMQRMADAIPGAHFALLPGVGHLAHLETPEAFVAAVQGFLA